MRKGKQLLDYPDCAGKAGEERARINQSVCETENDYIMFWQSDR